MQELFILHCALKLNTSYTKEKFAIFFFKQEDYLNKKKYILLWSKQDKFSPRNLSVEFSHTWNQRNRNALNQLFTIIQSKY